MDDRDDGVGAGEDVLKSCLPGGFHQPPLLGGEEVKLVESDALGGELGYGGLGEGARDSSDALREGGGHVSLEVERTKVR